METTKTEQIWSRYNEELYRFIRSRINSKPEAEDLLQEVFAKIHLNHTGLRSDIKLTSWVYQIARNTLTDYYRKKKLQYVELEDMPLVEDKDDNLNEDYLHCIKPAIEQLDENYKFPMLKTLLGSFSQKEYAKQTGEPYATIKSRVQRGRKKIKEIIQQCCDFKTDVYGNIVEVDTQKCTCSC